MGAGAPASQLRSVAFDRTARIPYLPIGGATSRRRVADERPENYSELAESCAALLQSLRCGVGIIRRSA
jgi:hypothetical protein